LQPRSGQELAAAAVKDIPGARAETLAIVFDNRKGNPEALSAAVDKVAKDGFKDVDAVKVDPQALQAARSAGDQKLVVMPLDVTASRDEAVDQATKLRVNLGVDDQAGATVPVHVVGQGALWAGLQELSKQDLEQAEFIGLPIVLIVLLLIFGSLAAADVAGPSAPGHGLRVLRLRRRTARFGGRARAGRHANLKGPDPFRLG
jgi:hypothetical protein